MSRFGIVLIAACGRVGFEPVAAIGSADGGMTPVGDSGAMTGDGSATGPCASAIAVSVGTRAAESTCGTDAIDGCGPAGTAERIYKFVVPATASYSFAARNATDNNISNSFGLLDASCQPAGICAGLYSTSYSAGDVVFFAVEASAGGCANIRIDIMQQ